MKYLKVGGEVEPLQEIPINNFLYTSFESKKMPTYPIINKKTGEQKEVVMSIHDWDQWSKDNVDWIRDWSDPSTAPSPCEIGEWRDKLINRNPGWNEVLEKVSKAPKSQVKKL